MYVMAVFIDLKIAFEEVRHEILLKKLRFNGGKESAFECFGVYLFGGGPRAKVSGIWSPVLKSSVDVPQSSVLGPLLLLIYVNVNDCAKIAPYIFI